MCQHFEEIQLNKQESAGIFSILFARLKANQTSRMCRNNSLMGSHLPLNSSGNVMQQGHMMISSCILILNSVLFHFNRFFLSSLYFLR